MRAAVAVGNEGFFFAEEGALGYLTAGAYSNADMVANYAGFLFYLNLTRPVSLKGETRPAMLERDGGTWRLADHVTPDSDFFRAFISDHLNEALNPSHFERGMRETVRKAIRDRRAMVLWRYRDAHEQRRPPAWFEQKARALSTYYGQDYGHRGSVDELITIADACFARFPLDASPAARNEAGLTPLHTAVLFNDAARVRHWLEQGAAVDAAIVTDEPTNREAGSTPLHLAARDGRDALVALLLRHGASVDATNALAQTPLHKAVGHASVMRRLIEAGASVSARDASGRTPLHWAAYEPSGDTTGLLVEAGAAVDAVDKHGATPLHRAAAGGRVEATGTLLRHGASASAAADFGLRPMHRAAINDHPAVIRRLSEHGASVGVRDAAGWTPLHDAAHRARHEAIAALLAAGASPTVDDTYGTTPLHLACRAGQRLAALTLLERGAAARATSRRGVSPLHEAAFGGDRRLVEALLEAGATPARADARGRTAAAVARDAGHDGIAALLGRRAEAE